jgi:hypothetical protein
MRAWRCGSACGRAAPRCASSGAPEAGLRCEAGESLCAILSDPSTVDVDLVAAQFDVLDRETHRYALLEVIRARDA